MRARSSSTIKCIIEATKRPGSAGYLWRVVVIVSHHANQPSFIIGKRILGGRTLLFCVSTCGQRQISLRYYDVYIFALLEFSDIKIQF